MRKEEMREGFEAWHCEQYKTKHTTGEPTRDMHNGVRDENYCSKKSQALWECWQETGGDVAKVEALKDEIERIEEGKQPVAWRCTGDIGTPHVTDSEDCANAWYSHGGQVDALFTRSDAGEVEALREELAELEDEFDTLEHSNISLKLALQAAEQRIASLYHVGMELMGVIDEYRAMPCDSLKLRMFQTADRYRLRLTAKCQTCKDKGVVYSDFNEAEGGFTPEPCPDCEKPTESGASNEQ